MEKFNEFKTTCKKNLQDFHTVMWENNVMQSSKCYLYKNFKTALKFEEYLCKIPDDLRISFTKFRICNHKLPIERGRHLAIDRKFRICNLCDKRDLGDEFHYLFICPKFKHIRHKFLPKECLRHPSVLKFTEIMRTESMNTLKKIARFSQIIMKIFDHL